MDDMLSNVIISFSESGFSGVTLIRRDLTKYCKVHELLEIEYLVDRLTLIDTKNTITSTTNNSNANNARNAKYFIFLSLSDRTELLDPLPTSSFIDMEQFVPLNPASQEQKSGERQSPLELQTSILSLN